MTMVSGVYIGPIQHLKGEGALLMYKSENSKVVLAQFDNFDAHIYGTNLALGWHMFQRSSFLIKDELESAES